MVRVAVPEPVTVVGSMDVLIPAGLLVVKETVPENPLSDVTVMVEVPEDPAARVRLPGLALMKKSGVVDAWTASPIASQ
jgi:hypothetical protein